MNGSDIADKFRDSFKEESLDNISDIEQALLNIELISNQDVINSVFRNFHTIKGSSGMFGFTFTESIVHEIETVLDVIKVGKAIFSQATIDATLMAVDFVRELIEGDEKISEVDFKNREVLLINAIKNSLNVDSFHKNDEYDFSEHESRVSLNKQSLIKGKLDEESLNAQLKVYKILFYPSRGLLFQGHNPIKLLRKLIDLGKGHVSIRAIISDIPNLDVISPDNVYVNWEIKLKTEESKETIEEVFVFLDLQSKVIVEEIYDNFEISNEVNGIECLNSNLLDHKKVKKSSKFFSEKENLISNFDLKEERIGLNMHDTSKSKVNIASIKVDSKKLDHLVNLVGELVTIQSKLAKESENSNNNVLNSISAEFSMLINELRDYTTNLRTVPIEILFVKFQRIVKDLSAQLGKSILYHIQGGDTVLDKSIIEKLNEPLVHLIRNSIDHGIESLEERENLGKDPKGIIKLSAYQSRDSVIVVIEDDGRGLDRNKIIKKALERNMVSETVSKTLSDVDVYNFIFEPGFSTASSVTNMSGRGVGMDVVRKQVESLRGNVIIESEFGKYTKVKLIFPLTLAIIEGWLVRVDKEYFIVPLSSVESCLDSNKLVAQIDGAEGKNNVMNYRGSMISFIRLREFFEISEDKSFNEQVVVVNTNNGKMGFVVDEVLGQHQTVIKALGKIYSRVEGVSGATILGDGSLALVVDVDAITKLVK